MDKSWMDEDRHTETFINGVKGFIQFAFTHSAKGNTILCPCRKCVNCSWLEASDVQVHLICDGFVNDYRRWEYHGEASYAYPPNSDADVECDEVEEVDELDDMGELIRDMRHEFGDLSDSDAEADSSDHDDPNNPFKQLLGAAAEELYPGCTSFSKLRFIVRMLHNKALGGWTDKSFDMQLESMKAKAALLRKKKEATLIQNREATQHQKREAEILEKKRKETELQKKEKEAKELQKKEAEQLEK